MLELTIQEHIMFHLRLILMLRIKLKLKTIKQQTFYTHTGDIILRGLNKI